MKKRDIAGFIMEPIICNLGVLVPEQEFMTRLQELLLLFPALTLDKKTAKEGLDIFEQCL